MIATFTAFCIAIGTLCLRLYVLCTKGTEYVASETHYFSVEAGMVRGEILDCHGVKLVDNDYENIAVLKPTMKAYSVLENVTDTDTLEDIRERMKKMTAISVNIGKNEIEQNSDAVMLKKRLRYNKNQLARHIIGYLDSQGRGVTGIEKSFDSLLYTGQSLKVRFPADAYGRIISGARAEISNSNPDTASVVLTLDADIQRITENALDISDVNQGGAVVADVKTGAIRAMASRPDFDTDNLADYINADGSPMVNRCLGAYAVGSVFKAAVAAAALENGITDFYYTCKGTCDVDGTVFGCNNRKAHGELNMQKALECSCNTYFVNLAKKIGGEKLLEAVKNLGFGQQIKLTDILYADSGTLPSAEELNGSGALANFSFGQGSLTASMLQMIQLFSAIANGGKYSTPYLIEKTVSLDGAKTEHKQKYPVVALKNETADRLKNMLVSVVENGNASGAKMKNEIKAAGKTATAQTGAYNKYGVEICNTWFCGFFPAENPEYVIVIMKEGGSSGAEDCAPVFKRIADKISDLNRSEMP